MKFLTEAGERALEQAIEAIESVSSAEVVIAIRPRARFSLVQHAVVAFVAAFGMLAFTLYSPLEFSLWEILVFPLFAALAGAVTVEAVPPLYRWLQPRWARYEHVREAAYATFVERGIHTTRDRTGILVYVALRERMVEVVADIGVLKHHGIEVLAAWGGTLEAYVPQGAEAFGKQLATLAPELAETLPRRVDDIDELSNSVHVFGAPPRQRKKGLPS
jgi:putative membrane protein